MSHKIADNDSERPTELRGLRRVFSRLLSRERRVASIPLGMRVYAVGDIHGRLDLLDRLIEQIGDDSSSAPSERLIVYMGDYIDRGPGSKGVIERLLAPPHGFQARHLRGNHDQFFLDFLVDPTSYRFWKKYGALQTLLSYGVMPPRFDDDRDFAVARDELADALPPAHLKFFSGLKLSEEIGGYFFAHAGVRPGLPLARQLPEDLLGIRDDFLTSDVDFGKVVVHGHTPCHIAVRRANRIGVDTGAYATGRLTCAVLEGEECRFLQT
jgi:serine/threonine protein phosphatase 1